MVGERGGGSFWGPGEAREAAGETGVGAGSREGGSELLEVVVPT